MSLFRGGEIVNNIEHFVTTQKSWPCFISANAIHKHKLPYICIIQL